jgi:DNA polymerase-3 subunit alpha
MQERGHGSRDRFGKGGVVLIAQDAEGFRNLSGLVSRAHLEGENGRAAGMLPWLTRENLQGIICLSGGPEGAIDPYFAANMDAVAEGRLERLAGLFGDRFYLELQRHGRKVELANEAKLIDLAYRKSIPLVATNEPFYPAPKEYEAHDALLAIARGSVVAQTERRKLSTSTISRPATRWCMLFADLPEALDSTIEIAQRVSYRPRTAQAGAADRLLPSPARFRRRVGG